MVVKVKNYFSKVYKILYPVKTYVRVASTGIYLENLTLIFYALCIIAFLNIGKNNV